jgi:4-amino-4-deoxy-L-arabinose transferase-like glycosyltransferase
MSTMGRNDRSADPLATTPWSVFAFAAGALALEIALSGRYGYHRDELYFIECSRHLAFGYVDQPPITPILAGIGNALFHGSLVGFRLLPAFAMSAMVVLAAFIARELGADRFAQGSAALAVALTPEYLAGAHLVSPTVFDWLLWTIGFLVTVRLLRTGNERLWAVLGLVLGIGLENKWNAAFFAFGLVTGLLLTPERRLLRSWWVAAGAGIALAIWAPNLLWQATHGWPQFQVFEALRGDAWHNRAVYVPAQIVYVGVLLAPVWVAGLVWLFRNPVGRPFRSLAWMYVVLIALFFVLGGKPYYPGGMYTLLLAAGSIPIARYLRDPARRILKPTVAIVTLVAVSGLLLPIALPVLPVRDLATVPVQNINYDMGETVGWPQFAATVARVYRSLPPIERRKAVILTANYGEAGAIDRFGSSLGLPIAYSGHNNFWLWGPPSKPGITIAVNLDPSQLRPYFAEITKVATFTNGLGVQNDEQGIPIYMCRGQRLSWPRIWLALRDYS